MYYILRRGLVPVIGLGMAAVVFAVLGIIFFGIPLLVGYLIPDGLVRAFILALRETSHSRLTIWGEAPTFQDRLGTGFLLEGMFVVAVFILFVAYAVLEGSIKRIGVFPTACHTALVALGAAIVIIGLPLLIGYSLPDWLVRGTVADSWDLYNQVTPGFQYRWGAGALFEAGGGFSNPHFVWSLALWGTLLRIGRMGVEQNA